MGREPVAGAIVSAHTHTVAREGRDYGYSGHVGQAEAAAGNIERQEFCSCGASRWVAINGRHRAEGPWSALAYGVIRITLPGRAYVHTVVSTHDTAGAAWSALERDTTNKSGYVARVPSASDGHVLTADQQRRVERKLPS